MGAEERISLILAGIKDIKSANPQAAQCCNSVLELIDRATMLDCRRSTPTAEERQSKHGDFQEKKASGGYPMPNNATNTQPAETSQEPTVDEPNPTSAVSSSPSPTTPPLRRSTRVRRPPGYLRDYEALPFSREGKMYR
ncbi:hypothetical protein HPB52_007606 [Rhipicephalus sanguineus]|uniref:Uncharacterized protein n=1 Tax=Rhipicephalus sanguineus TaxID=34632 RepID=A0A9D4Q640_RHISA|nr:hypothetical protein HPB52_007606 [Rhipicephalus sanguineus]